MKTLSKLDTKNQIINTHPEIELLLSCLNPDINDAITERIKTLVKQNIDWQYLTQTADRHGVLSLMYSRFNSICPEAIPEPILNQWRKNFQAVAQRNLFLTGELVNLLKLLKQQNIVALPYKGPILATLIYKNVALRRFGDLDIIVQQKDIFAVRELLIAQGYQPKIEMTDAE
ncbi:MAG: nucleotidyltransferase family protein, partial [Richelia sp. RM1_1_1]|nr:nucleotidyltransferase family protein [Richelia sp. RM1_1_1]